VFDDVFCNKEIIYTIPKGLHVYNPMVLFPLFESFGLKSETY